MSRLVDDINHAGGPRVLSVGHGGPCPLCAGERSVAVYFRFQVIGPQMGHGYNAAAEPDNYGSRKKERTRSVIGGAQQGLCLECATALYLEVARKIGRWDRVRALEGADGEGQR